MQKEMINIDANLVSDIKIKNFFVGNRPVVVANFTLVKKYGKGKEYINCAVYGKKTKIVKDFEKGDLIHVFGYFKERVTEYKTYKNFIVQSINKINKEEN